MKNYPALRNVLISIFSVDTGFSEAEETAAFERTMRNPICKSEIEKELKQLFQDQDISWTYLLDNHEYVVYPADDEIDAKKYIIDHLWKKVFPS